MTGRFAGRIAVITGASRGIGAAVAQRFAAEGAREKVVSVDRNAEAIAELLNAPVLGKKIKLPRGG